MTRKHSESPISPSIVVQLINTPKPDVEAQQRSAALGYLGFMVVAILVLLVITKCS